MSSLNGLPPYGDEFSLTEDRGERVWIIWVFSDGSEYNKFSRDTCKYSDSVCSVHARIVKLLFLRYYNIMLIKIKIIDYIICDGQFMETTFLFFFSFSIYFVSSFFFFRSIHDFVSWCALYRHVSSGVVVFYLADFYFNFKHSFFSDDFESHYEAFDNIKK